MINDKNKCFGGNARKFVYHVILSIGVCFIFQAQAAPIFSQPFKVKASLPKKPEHRGVNSSTRLPNKSTNKIIVKFKPGISNTETQKIIAARNTRLSTRLKSIPRVNILEVPDRENLDDLLNIYKSDPNVEYAEPDYAVHLRATIPDDISFNQLWALNNTGQLGGLTNADINAPEAWDITTGDSSQVVVAVVDTGIDYTHVDLANNVWVNPNEIPGNNIDDDGNGYVDDVHGIDTGENDTDPMDTLGHGTHVSGTITAQGNNSLGTTGVSWNTKVIACKIFSPLDPDLNAFISDAIECLDYLYDLKMNRGINIIATNNSWGWRGPESLALKESIQMQANAGILFVAAAGNDSSNNDIAMDYPSNYYLSNVISVAASDRFDMPAYFTNYGAHTVHIAAPGHEILSTVPGRGVSQIGENPYRDVFFDNMENGLSNWVANSPWGTTTLSSFSPNTSLTDSPNGNYVNSANTSVTSQILDLSGLNAELKLGFFARYQIESGFDNLYIEASGNGGLSWVTLGSITGQQSTWVFYEFSIPPSVRTSEFVFRFHLITDGFVVYDGIYLDDIGVGAVPTGSPTGSNQYAIASGTSMAAPHVVGVLALLAAENIARTWSQLKNLVLAGGSDVPSFSEITISGKRLRAADNNGSGSLTCENQVVLKRLMPQAEVLTIDRGGDSMLNVSMLHINCDQPAGALNATVLETGQTISLLDNGTGFDQVEGDGIYSGQIPLAFFTGDYNTIVLPNGENLSVTFVDNYSAQQNVTYQWRDISSVQNPLLMGDVSWAQIISPFPVHFADDSDGYNSVNISSKGFIALTKNGTPVSFNGSVIEHHPLPYAGTANIIAAYWTDLFPGGGGSVSWGVLGTQPNREFVIQWENVPFYSAPPNGVSFQIVLFENSADVLFNYADVSFGIPELDNGAYATVGIQVGPTSARQFSYDAPLLANQTSLLWQFFNPSVNYPPSIVRPENVVAIAGETLAFTIYSGDRNGSPPLLSVEGLPVGAVFDSGTGEFTWTNSGPPGQYTLTFTAIDAQDSSITSSVSMMITLEENHAPLFVGQSDLDVVAGQNVQFTVELEELNAMRPILSTEGLPDVAFVRQVNSDSPTKFRWQFVWNNAHPEGRYNVAFTARDAINADLIDTLNVVIDVQQNYPPVLQVPEDIVVAQGDAVEFTVSVSDFNETRGLLRADGVPVGSTFSSESGIFRWPNTASVGMYTLTFTAVDALDPGITSTGTLTITVEENVAPQISVIRRFSIVKDQPLDFLVSVSDRNRIAPTLYANDLPEQASFDPITRAFSWLGAKEPGIYTVTFIAVDSNNPRLLDTDTVVIEVEAVASKTGGDNPGGDSGGGGPIGLYLLAVLAALVSNRARRAKLSDACQSGSSV